MTRNPYLDEPAMILDHDEAALRRLTAAVHYAVREAVQQAKQSSEHLDPVLDEFQALIANAFTDAIEPALHQIRCARDDMTPGKARWQARAAATHAAE